MAGRAASHRVAPWPSRRWVALWVALAVAAGLACGCSSAGARSHPPSSGVAPRSPAPEATEPAATEPGPAPGPTGPGVVSSLPAIATTTAGVPATIGGWTLVGRTFVAGPASDQGLATVTRPGGATEIEYAGDADVTAALSAAGWDHVGDPDGWDGWLVTPFQGPAGTAAKMFESTSPTGRVIQAVHPLSPGEEYNNSFAAVTPDGQWTVSGEWGEMDRLLVFPTPGVNGMWQEGAPLPMVATVQLSPPVSDVQGCSFLDATTLVCADLSDLIEVDLDRPLSAAGASGTVRVLGPVPEVGGCSGTYEPEGVDIDRALGQLRFAVNQPGVCSLFTQVYEYRLSGS